jgi:hypothetical protein
MPASKESLGNISRWTFKAGVVLAILLTVIMLLLRDRNVLQLHDIRTAAGVILTVLAVVMAFSFVCGVVARGTQAGRSGMILAGTALLLLIAHLLFSFQMSWWGIFLLVLLVSLALRRPQS